MHVAVFLRLYMLVLGHCVLLTCHPARSTLPCRQIWPSLRFLCDQIFGARFLKEIKLPFFCRDALISVAMAEEERVAAKLQNQMEVIRF